MRIYTVFILQKDEDPSEVAAVIIDALKARGFIKREEVVEYHIFGNVLVIYRSKLRPVFKAGAVKGI